ncbi:MAG: glycoside hydrolase family 3 N-terminal domain-containing protein [Candidatus Dactylopiibacterium sp.]|nr:glycoside hydrolase family 3 N-terminal domain-containing protein [Candidatus Dactylopiibacterium sp.]
MKTSNTPRSPREASAGRFRARRLGLLLAGSAVALAACGGSDDSDSSPEVTQPVLATRVKSLLMVDGKQFKDLNANGQLDPYEDWRLTAERRADDLVARMSLEDKAGMMMIDTLNSGCEGSLGATAYDYVQTQKMTRFILRSTAKATAESCSASPANTRSGYVVTPQQLAQFANGIQELAEARPLGIPVVFKDNARNHFETDPRFGISAGAGAFTEFPKEAGLAAAALGDEYLKTGKTTTGDMSVIASFTEVMGQEYKAVGLRALYGYMADLATEPRWYRVHETFTEDADLNANIMTALVKGLQGGPVSSKTAVAMTMKHFPGGGPQEQGLDPHYSFGKNQVYPGNNFGYHLKPFMAAIDAGVSSIMPYYGVPIGVTYEGVTYDQVGMSFSKQIVTDLLRGKLGFRGYVNSDTGIIDARAWGLEDKTVAQRVATAINGGTDILSGYHTNRTITDLVAAGEVGTARVDEAVRRLLLEQFQLGLFENPYVDASKAGAIIGSEAHRAKGMEAQKKSIVLLQNQTLASGGKALPLPAGAKVYTLGMSRADVERYGYTVTDGNYTAPAVRPSAAGHDYAVIRVLIKDAGSPYASTSPATGANPAHLNPLTGRTWGSQDPCVMFPAVNASCADTSLMFGGALPWENDMLSFSTIAAASSRTMSPSLADIQAVMAEIGDAKKVVLSVYFRAPYVLDDASGVKNAGAIVASFGASDQALLEILSGKFKPQGRMPFALPRTLDAVVYNQPDVPGFKETRKPDGTALDGGELYPFGYGLSY